MVRPLLKQYGFGATFFITEGFDFPDNKKDYMYMKYLAVNDYKVLALRELSEYVDPHVKPTDPLDIVRKRKRLLGNTPVGKSR